MEDAELRRRIANLPALCKAVEEIRVAGLRNEARSFQIINFLRKLSGQGPSFNQGF